MDGSLCVRDLQGTRELERERSIKSTLNEHYLEVVGLILLIIDRENSEVLPITVQLQ